MRRAVVLKLDADVAKAGPGAAVTLNNIKVAAAGGTPPCPPAEEKKP